MAKIYFWNRLLNHDEKFNPYRPILQRLLQGEYRELSLEKLRGHQEPALYSIRVNHSDRILFTTFEDSICLLDVIENHDYEKSRFLKKGVARAFLSKLERQALEESADLLFEAHEESLPLNTVDEKTFSPLEVHDGHLVELNDEQTTVIHHARLPAIVYGPAGSGKTCLAFPMFQKLLQNETLEKPLVYVSQNPQLVAFMRQMWFSMLDEDGRPDSVLFKTYLELIAESLGEGQTLVEDDACFNAWFETQDDLNPTQKTRYWQEFRICSVYDEEKYLALGEHKSSKSIDERREVFDAFRRYIAHLERHRLVSPAFALLADDVRFGAMVVDEAQDFSYMQLDNLFRLSSGQVLYNLGEHQTLADGQSRYDYLREMLHAHLGKMPDVVQLKTTYRCPKHVAQMATLLIQMKRQVTRGAVDKAESDEVSSHALMQDGQVHWQKACDETLKARVLHTDCAIISLDREKTRSYFGTPLVFTPESIKGLQYPMIVLHDFFSTSQSAAANEKLRGLSSGKVPRHRAKPGTYDDTSLLWFNQLITSITRAQRELIFVQTTHHTNEIFVRAIQEKIASFHLASAPHSLPSSRTTPEDWEKEAARLLQRGLVEMADDIFINVLGRSKTSFETWRRSLMGEAPIQKPKVVSIEGGAYVATEPSISTPVPPKMIEPERPKSPKILYLQKLLDDFTSDRILKLFNILSCQAEKERMELLFETKISKNESFMDKVLSDKNKFAKFYDSLVHQEKLSFHLMTPECLRRLEPKISNKQRCAIFHVVMSLELTALENPELVSWLEANVGHNRDTHPIQLATLDGGGIHLWCFVFQHFPSLLHKLPSSVFLKKSFTPQRTGVGQTVLEVFAKDKDGALFLKNLHLERPSFFNEFGPEIWIHKNKREPSLLQRFLMPSAGGDLIARWIKEKNPIIYHIPIAQWMGNIWKPVGEQAVPVIIMLINHDPTILPIFFQNYPEIIQQIPLDYWHSESPGLGGVSIFHMLFHLTDDGSIPSLEALFRCPNLIDRFPSRVWYQATHFILKDSREDFDSIMPPPLLKMVCTKEYNPFFRLLVREHPKVIESIPVEIWAQPFGEGKPSDRMSLISFLLAYQGNLEILVELIRHYPHVIAKIPTSAWLHDYHSDRLNTPLRRLLAFHENYVVLLEIIKHCPSVIENIPLETWCRYLMPPGQRSLSEAPLVWLLSNSFGQQFLLNFLSIFPGLYDAFRPHIWELLLTYDITDLGNLTNLHALSSKRSGSRLLLEFLKHPFIIESIPLYHWSRVENLVINGPPGPSDHIIKRSLSPLTFLCLMDGHEVLAQLIMNYPKIMQSGDKDTWTLSTFITIETDGLEPRLPLHSLVSDLNGLKVIRFLLEVNPEVILNIPDSLWNFEFHGIVPMKALESTDLGQEIKAILVAKLKPEESMARGLSECGVFAHRFANSGTKIAKLGDPTPTTSFQNCASGSMVREESQLKTTG